MSEDQADKLNEILRLCRDMANQLVEHDVALKFIKSELDVNSDDAGVLKRRVADLAKAVDELTRIADGQDRRIREASRSIDELQAEENRRAAGADER